MKKVRFIINPNSGASKKSDFSARINQCMESTDFRHEITFTKARKHATELAAEAAKHGYEIVVAVGGDGSVNEVAAGLAHTDTSLAIVPTGSGNGMARHLKIPMNFEAAVTLISKGEKQKIDTVRVNEHFCIGTAGFGFDAYIANLFDKAGTRGYSTYVKLVLTEFSRYPSKPFSILADDKRIEKNCFLLTFANSSQFGNNAVIAPFADVKDGLLEISMMDKFPVLVAPSLIYRMMNNSIHLSKYFSGSKASRILIENRSHLLGHIDGEPVSFDGNVKIETDPLSLYVIAGSK